MRNVYAWIAATLVAFALAGCGGKTYTLQLNPKEGDTYDYSTKVTGSLNMEVDLSMKVAKVTSDKVVIETRYRGITMNGQPLAGPQADVLKNVVMSVTDDRLGHPLSTDVTGAPAAMTESMKKQGGGLGAAYPDHPVKIGDTWTSEGDVQGQKLKLTYKLVKVAPVGGKDAAFLEATPDASSTMKISGPMTLTVDLATGMPISTNFSGEANGQKVMVEMKRS